MRKLALLALLLFAVKIDAATITATACTSTAVQTAITSSSNGDTVLVPLGSCGTGTIWAASSVTISSSHQITLNGQGQTVNFANPGTDPGFGVTVLSITTGNANNTIITGFTFNGAYTNGRAPITLFSSGSQTYRFFNNTFNYTGSFPQGSMVVLQGDGPGLFDHNTFFTTINFTEMIHNFGSNSQTADWSSDVVPGSLTAVYIETNTFTGPGSGGGYSQAVENFQGARVVFRYNTLNNTGFDAHGSTSPTGFNCSEVNTRWYEVYNNTWTTTQGDWPTINLRGGSGLIFNNTHPAASAGIQFQADCDSGTSGVPYPYQDQDGRGITISSGSSTTNISPIYLWNNATFGSGTTTRNGNPTTYIVAGRDYFCSGGSACAGPLPTLTRCESAADVVAGCPVTYTYTPAVYPHPLTATASTQISITPSAANYGTVNVGSNSTQTFTVSNVGNATNTLSTPFATLATGTQYAIVSAGSPACSNALALTAGTSCQFGIKFTPLTQATLTDTVTIHGTTNVSGSLTGVGQTSSSIPSVPTGFSVSGSGGAGAPINTSWTASTGTPPITYNCLVSGPASGVGGPYTVYATTSTTSCLGFVPGFTGVYHFEVSATNSSGTSAATAPAAFTVNPATSPSANVNPATYAFHNVPIGTTQGSTGVTLTNVGTATLSSIVITIGGPNAADFAETDTCTGSLAVNANCVITPTFTPSTLFPVVEQGTINIASNDPNTPDVVTMTGSGVSTVQVSPLTLNFGNIYNNKTSSAQVVTFANNSGVSAVFSSVALTTGTQYAIYANTCLGTLTAGSTCTVSLTFTPTSAGAKTDTLTFTFTGPSGSPITVSLSGSGSNHKVRKGVTM